MLAFCRSVISSPGTVAEIVKDGVAACTAGTQAIEPLTFVTLLLRSAALLKKQPPLAAEPSPAPLCPAAPTTPLARRTGNEVLFFLKGLHAVRPARA